MNNLSYIALIPLLPLAGFVLLGLLGKKYFKASGIIGTLLLFISAALAFYTAYQYFDSNVTGQYCI
jgi:NADH-quinone oxidoreductase subunit L